MGKRIQFKNMLCTLLVFSLLLPANVEKLQAEEINFRGYEGILYGDLDGDGMITVTDLSLMNQIINGSMAVDVETKERGDLNGDGKITKADMDLLSQYILGDITEFPVERQLDSIYIEELPKKLSYYVGDTIDTTGLMVMAWYKNGKSKRVTGYRVSGSTSSPGIKTVTISYSENGITEKAFYEIEVMGNYTITYDVNGGMGTVPTQSGKAGTAVNLSSVVPVKYYKVSFYAEGGKVSLARKQVKAAFKGWSRQRDGTGQLYKPGSSYKISENVIFYACYGGAVLGELPIPKKEGYIFKGWHTSSGIKATESLSISDNTGLYAKWEKKKDSTDNNDSNHKLEDNVQLPDKNPAEDNNQLPDNKPTEGDSFPDGNLTDVDNKAPDEGEVNGGDLFPDDNADNTGNQFPSDEPEDGGTLFPDDSLVSDEDGGTFEEETEEAMADGDKYIVEWNVTSVKMQKGKSTTAIKAYVSEGDKVKAYYSSNKAIVVVSRKGKITAKRKGIAYVTVTTKRGAKAKVKIKVQTGAVKTKKLSVNKKKVTLKVGASCQLKVKLKPITASEKVTFRSANPKVAKVSKGGKVKAKKKGTTVILVKSGKKSAKVKVVVKK